MTDAQFVITTLDSVAIFLLAIAIVSLSYRVSKLEER